ncbi:MAG: nodulation protein NfeD [Candidatus Kapabacteria bacterium]|nr:nodulation protein NfeD [Candidatus Kapabacteria bacterium]
MKKALIAAIVCFAIWSGVTTAPNATIAQEGNDIIRNASVTMITIEGGISPAVASYIITSLEKSEEMGAEAMLLRLNTPGGLLESTRDIVSTFLNSKIPIIVYVAPGGSRAGSAGVFITLAAHVAVMAPGTNIGAAHPVGIDGSSDSSSAMTSKIVNDTKAFIRTIAEKRNRNIAWAEQTVESSISSTETEALAEGAIDFIAVSVKSLLDSADGMVVTTASGQKKLRLRDVEIIEIEKSWRDHILMTLSDPNIAYLLIMLGIYGLIFELKSPGSIAPGVVGGISLLLAAYSLKMLPVNMVGVAFILLAFILFVIEFFVQSYGLLSVSGVVSLFFGSILLIDSPLEFMRISMTLIVVVTLATAVFVAILAYYGIKAQSRKKEGGSQAVIGMTGTARTDFVQGTGGKVHVYGELWQAKSDDDIKIGDKVTVTAIEGFTLIVKKV